MAARVPYDPLNREDTSLIWFTHTANMLVQMQQLKVTMKDNGEGKPSLWVQLRVAHLAVPCAWSETEHRLALVMNNY